MIPGGATLTPAGFTDDREAARLGVNACIGTSGRFDAVDSLAVTVEELIRERVDEGITAVMRAPVHPDAQMALTELAVTATHRPA